MKSFSVKSFAYILITVAMTTQSAVAMEKSLEQLAHELDAAYDAPKIYQVSLDLVERFVDDKDVIYVEQWAYQTATGKVKLRTGLVSSCVVMALYNPTTMTGTMIHLAAENYGYLMTALMSEKEFPGYNKIALLIEEMGGAAEISAHLVGGNDNAMSLWQKYLEQNGVSDVKAHYYPQWAKSTARGESPDELLAYVKTRGTKMGFVELCCASGAIRVSQNGDQFKGHMGFVGKGPQDLVFSIVDNTVLTQFYQQQNPQWHRNLRVWGMWPSGKYYQDQSCAYCKETNAPKVCGRCKILHYCSEACQKRHWQIHRDNCKQ